MPKAHARAHLQPGLALPAPENGHPAAAAEASRRPDDEASSARSWRVAGPRFLRPCHERGQRSLARGLSPLSSSSRARLGTPIGLERVSGQRHGGGRRARGAEHLWQTGLLSGPQHPTMPLTFCRSCVRAAADAGLHGGGMRVWRGKRQRARWSRTCRNSCTFSARREHALSASAQAEGGDAGLTGADEQQGAASDAQDAAMQDSQPPEHGDGDLAADPATPGCVRPPT